MLDNYIKKQPIAYKIFKNAVIKNRIMHAYLIETKGYSEQLDLAIAFAKYLLCPYSYTNFNKCENCSQCTRIDEGNFTEIQIIEPDGQVIRKEQLDLLQKNFSRKALESNRKIYIINHAEKMNLSAANSILKFLEEPEENIIAILLVDNMYQVLNTILSRCQIITLNNKILEQKSMLYKIGAFLYDSEEKINEYENSLEAKETIEHVLNFIKYYENNKLDTILFMQKLWNDFFADKVKSTLSLNILLLFYKDILNYKLTNNIEYMQEYKENIIDISNKNKIDDLIRKISAIIKAQDKLGKNINQNLLMDKLVMDMEGYCG